MPLECAVSPPPHEEKGHAASVVALALPSKEKLGLRFKSPPHDVDSVYSTPFHEEVGVDDLLVAVAGQPVDDMSYVHVVEQVQQSPRPMKSSFEIDAAQRALARDETPAISTTSQLVQHLATFTVAFDEGSMGLNLEDGAPYGISGAIVRAMKGQAKASDQICVGDIVSKVNDTDVLCMPYTEVMELLRTSPSPKTLEFVPKSQLVHVQRVNHSRHSTRPHQGDHTESIAQLILDNQNATIKKGHLFKQGLATHNWKSRYFVLSVSKIEYFENPSSTTSRGELSFLNHRCSVRSLRGSSEVVCTLQGKAAVEAAMAEAQRAKEEADQQAAEAKRAQEEAKKLIEANRRIQEQSEELGQGHSSQFGEYRAMVQSGAPHDAVRQKMRDDGIEESSIGAFFDGINSYEQKIRQLQEKVEKLRRRPSKREEPKTEDMFAHLDMDQVKLLRRLLKLEKQLQQAGIAVAVDIPYEEAKQKVEEIAKRMGAIGSADVTHSDPEIQRSLREEYYRLERDMEKYNTALLLTDEYAAEEARKDANGSRRT